MDIPIKPLNTSTLNDYLYFFDHITFTENPDWSKCYCLSFHFTGSNEQWSWERNRDSVIKFVNEGKMTDYIAYHNDKPVGWCNANNRLNYQRLLKYYKIDNQEDKVCSVVCFLIHPDYRRQGIAKKLLERVVNDCSAQNYDYIEAYPGKGELSCERHYKGPLDLYERNGFKIYKEFDNYFVVGKH